MSGFEIAGVLLGVLPILFEAVDLSKDGIQRSRILFRKRIYIERLALAVLLQQRTLAETVKSLLIESGCEDLALLDDDPVGYLNDKAIRSQVLDYLGLENNAAFSGALKQSDNIVKKIARNIAGLVPAVKVCFTSNVLHECLCLQKPIYDNRTPRTTCLKSSRRMRMQIAGS